MKKFFKYTLFTLVGVAMASLTSCNKDEAFDYVPAEAAGMQVYFSNEISSNIVVTDADSRFELPVLRQDSTQAVTVPVTIEYSSEEAAARWIPVAKEVSFAAGQKKAMLVFTFDPAKIEYDATDEIKVSIDPKYATAYGAAAATYTISKPAPWTLLGKGEVTEAYQFDMTVNVDFYQNDLDPTLYRIESPTIPMLKYFGEAISKEASEWLYIRVLHKGDKVLGQVIPEDGMILFYGDGAHNSFNTGWTNSSYNDDVCWVFPGIFTKYPTPDKWAHNKVLDYQEDGTVGSVQLAPYIYMWNNGGWDKSQTDGIITINFPGYEPKDYEMDVEFKGRLIDTKENGSAIFDITLGADIASAKYLMGDGKDPLPIYYGILDEGTEGVETITSSQEVKIAYAEGGDKTIVVVGFDAEGNEVGAIYTTINIPTGGGAETWTALYIGNYYHCVKSYSSTGGSVWNVKYPDAINEGSVLYISDQDESRYLISPWINGDLIFTMDEDLNLVVDNCDTGVENEGANIAATDFITCNVANIQSKFNGNDQFTFYLGWHILDAIEEGFYGYTADVFALTGEAAESPANLKMCTPKATRKLVGKKGVKNHLLERDVKKFSATKSSFEAYAKKHLNTNAKFTAKKK